MEGDEESYLLAEKGAKAQGGGGGGGGGGWLCKATGTANWEEFHCSPPITCLLSSNSPGLLSGYHFFQTSGSSHSTIACPPFLSLFAPPPPHLFPLSPSLPLLQPIPQTLLPSQSEKAKAGRQAGNEICFSPHSTPYRLSSPAPGSFTCCMTGPALYWNKSSPRTDAHVCMHVCVWARETSQGFLRALMGILSWAWPPDYHPALECMCVYVCIINASGCDLPTLLSAWFMLSPSTLCFSASRPLPAHLDVLPYSPTLSLCCFLVDGQCVSWWIGVLNVCVLCVCVYV